MIARCLILAVLLCAASPALADELRLANGDRISGRVVSLAGGTLAFATDHGELLIPWPSVAALTIVEPILATIEGGTPASVTIAAAPEPQRAILTPGGPTELQRITALARPQPPVIVDGSANAGLVSSSGNTDVNSLRLDGDVMTRAGANRYTASAAVTRSEDSDVETARNWSSSIKYDRFLTPRLFVNGNAIFINDRFRDLDLRTALGGGLGYQILQGPIVTLTADAGMGWVNENLGLQPDVRYAAARESAALTVMVIPDRVQLFHQHDLYAGVTGDDNLFFRTQNGVRLGLMAGFVTTLRLDSDYDRSPAPGLRNVDQTFSLTLGYRF